MDKKYLLELNNLSKQFITGGGFNRSKLMAVNKASFAVEEGKPEIFTLAGESGSGKTTLARIILGLIEPTTGSMKYKEREVADISVKEKRTWFMKEVQPIFQNPFETFSPLKKIDTYLYNTASNYKMADEAGLSLEEYINKKLGVVGLTLDEIAGRYPNELSGGQLQRTSVARSLLTEPSLLIADEPVSMVDASLRMSIVNLFKDLRDDLGVSVVYITHDLATAYYVSDRIAVMLRGIIVEMGDVRKVLDNPMHPYTQLLINSVPEPDPSKKWAKRTDLKTLESEEFMLKGCKFAGRCPHVMDICTRVEPEGFEKDDRTVKCYLYKD